MASIAVITIRSDRDSRAVAVSMSPVALRKEREKEGAKSERPKHISNTAAPAATATTVELDKACHYKCQ